MGWTKEMHKRLCVLLSVVDLGGGGSKQEVLDNVEARRYVKLSHEYQAKVNGRNESRWRNDLAFIRKHLVQEGFFEDQKWNWWSITKRGRSYLEKLCCEFLRNQEPGTPSLKKRVKELRKRMVHTAPKKTRGSAAGSWVRNPKAEQAAIRIVRRWYEDRRWDVTSVEAEKRGYDLLCKRGGAIKHVEVKGLSGSRLLFPITRRELKQAEEDGHFVLDVVTQALTRPQHCRYSGNEFLKAFSLEPLQLAAALKPGQQAKKVVAGSI